MPGFDLEADEDQTVGLHLLNRSNVAKNHQAKVQQVGMQKKRQNTRR